MARKRKKRPKLVPKDAALNIMPFIDIFSMLNTFLLVSASFVNLGVIEVQIPFFTSAPDDDKRPPRALEIKVDVEAEKVKLTTSWSEPPVDERPYDYPMTKEGLAQLHAQLVATRTQYPEADKVTVYSEDDVKYHQLIEVLDSIKVLGPDDPKIPVTDAATGEQTPTDELFEKVVIGSVVL